VKDFPVILFGKEYWSGLLDWLNNTVAAERKIDAKDLKLFRVTDDPAEVTRIVIEARNKNSAATHPLPRVPDADD
jgi:predicted Rossmann-fold nucleotide-binding protein